MHGMESRYSVETGALVEVLPTDAAAVAETARDLAREQRRSGARRAGTSAGARHTTAGGARHTGEGEGGEGHRVDAACRLRVALLSADCEYYDLGATHADLDELQSEATYSAAALRPDVVIDNADAMRANASGTGAATRAVEVLSAAGVQCILVRCCRCGCGGCGGGGGLGEGVGVPGHWSLMMPQSLRLARLPRAHVCTRRVPAAQVGGTVSDQVASHCRAAGIVVVSGVRLKTLQAVGAACGAIIVTDVFALRDTAVARVMPGTAPVVPALVTVLRGGWITKENAAVLPTLTTAEARRGRDAAAYEYVDQPLLMRVSGVPTYKAVAPPITVMAQGATEALALEAKTVYVAYTTRPPPVCRVSLLLVAGPRHRHAHAQVLEVLAPPAQCRRLQPGVARRRCVAAGVCVVAAAVRGGDAARSRQPPYQPRTVNGRRLGRRLYVTRRVHAGDHDGVCGLPGGACTRRPPLDGGVRVECVRAVLACVSASTDWVNGACVCAQDLLLLALQNDGHSFTHAATVVLRAQAAFACRPAAATGASAGPREERAALEARMRLRTLSRTVPPPLLLSIARRTRAPLSAAAASAPALPMPTMSFGRHARRVQQAAASDDAARQGPGHTFEKAFGFKRVCARGSRGDRRPGHVPGSTTARRTPANHGDSAAVSVASEWALPGVLDGFEEVSTAVSVAADAVSLMLQTQTLLVNTQGAGRVQL